MKLSTKGRYAVMAMVDLAQHGGDGPVCLSEIAERQEISQETADKIHSHPVATVVKVVAAPLTHDLSIPGTALAFDEAPTRYAARQ